MLKFLRKVVKTEILGKKPLKQGQSQLKTKCSKEMPSHTLNTHGEG